MEDDAPIIYGLEFQARALCTQVAETEIARFFVGTQSLKFENQIHQLEYDEENNILSKRVFLHGAGEVWHIAASPINPDYISTCYNHLTPDGKCEMEGAIWLIPPSKGGNDSPADDNLSTIPSVEMITKLDTSSYGNDVKSIVWHPVEGNQLISLVDEYILLWDIGNNNQAKLKASATADLKGKPKFTSLQWNPHQNCTQVATAIDTSIRGWDLRSMQQIWIIEGAHGQLVREFDFNPNRQYFLASCGDDCQAKFWDIRNPNIPVMVLSNHSHWIWSIRYNHFHDQLVLTSSSDSRVILSRVASISSEPFGHLIEDEETSSIDEGDQDRKILQDGVIATYEEHEDSVYATEWSSADPWLFASLSYDGRLVINKVPRAEKYRILL